MLVKIESIDQKMLLDTGALTTFLTLKLPNGSQVSAQVEPDTAQALINLVAQGGSVSTEAEPTQDLEVFSAPDGPEEDDLITWADLPEEHLSSRMKSILTETGVAAAMPVSSLTALVDQITERLLEAKIAQQAQQVQVGKVQRPNQLNIARPKTMPKDEAGYPIVSGSPDRDPGEVALMGTDEDGIPQL